MECVQLLGKIHSELGNQLSYSLPENSLSLIGNDRRQFLVQLLLPHSEIEQRRVSLPSKGFPRNTHKDLKHYMLIHE